MGLESKRQDARAGAMRMGRAGRHIKRLFTFAQDLERVLARTTGGSFTPDEMEQVCTEIYVYVYIYINVCPG